MIEYFIKKLKNEDELSLNDIETFVNSTVEGKNSKEELKTVLEFLSTRPVDIDEMFYFVKSLRSHSIRVEIPSENVTDSCGTGADGSSTFNISTSAAIVASAAGAKVAKQTNSNITSRSGSSDFLEALGVPIAQNPEQALEYFKENNIAFLHSPSFNKFAHVINPIRKEVKKRTLFNFTGPLINPVFPQNQVVGVSNIKMAEIIINVLKMLGLKHAFTVCAQNPLMDEVSICSVTDIFELKDGEITRSVFDPEEMGLRLAPLKELTGATPLYNANLVKDILNNKIHGPKLDVIALNTALMLMSAGLAQNMREGVITAYKTVIEGKTKDTLERLINGHRLLKTL